MITDDRLFDQLYTDGLISDASFDKIKQRQLNPLYSVHWEAKTALYTGIAALTTGLGILIYKNIDSIGHQVILILIALITAGCFAYCFKYKKPFRAGKVPAPSTFFNYVLLLGTLSMLIFTGYLQYQYRVFGSHYGLATFIPMVALFCIAYGFDHVGILNMAITNLGIWLGVSVSLKQLLAYNTFNNSAVIYTYLGFGLLLLLAAWLTQREKIKPHFKFSYEHYGLHVCFITLLAGYSFHYDARTALLWPAGLLLLAAIAFKDAYRQKIFYFLVLVLLYGYIAIGCLVARLLFNFDNFDGISGLFLYLILSATGLIYLMIRINKKLKAA